MVSDEINASNLFLQFNRPSATYSYAMLSLNICFALQPRTHWNQMPNKQCMTKPSSTTQHSRAFRVIDARSIHLKYIKRFDVCLPWSGRIHRYPSSPTGCTSEPGILLSYKIGYFFVSLPPLFLGPFNQNICRYSVWSHWKTMVLSFSLPCCCCCCCCCRWWCEWTIFSSIHFGEEVLHRARILFTNTFGIILECFLCVCFSFCYFHF